MNPEAGSMEDKETPPAGRLALWLLGRLRRTPRSQARLSLLERIQLAPRQSLALVEADGRRLLVATSPEGAPTFYALDGPAVSAHPPRRTHRAERRAGRISW
ncbi:MAG TPA: flagellar biosynthetic protein FliO [Terracidiphilus sp.]|nr:flagellar biosynthetic protein FliO [Terracidiphilus sp.]